MLRAAIQKHISHRSLYCTKTAANKTSYSNTVLLPKTKFPLRLENEKLIERDKSIRNAADFDNLYSWQRSHLSEPEFVLHDGPPYANGQPHMGHAINKILKDTILRYKILQGNKVHYVPGWDCHGLPIELKAILDGSEKDALKIRSKARNFAQKTIDSQSKIFQSWGVIGDWKKPYTTFDKDYIKTQLRQFFKMYRKKLIYRDYKPIYWSPSSRTALAEAELEYNDSHRSPSVYVRFQVKNLPNLPILSDKIIYALIWTTTPWTLPANLAVSFNENLSYSFLKKPDDDNVYIVASDLIQNVSKIWNCNFEIIKTVEGNLLKDATYIHPIYHEQEKPFLHSSHATASKGTGLVHIAGAHGPEDFLVALNNKLVIENLVDDNGCFNSKAGPKFEGKFVLSEGNLKVLDVIKHDVMHLGEIIHSYPYDWRTKNPVIIKASQQWFIDTNTLRDRATELLDSVNIYPTDRSTHYKRNFYNQLQKRPYWCISRQRKWGVPIPVFYQKNTSKIIIDENTINHQCNLLEKFGSDFWWKLPNEQLLPENVIDSFGLECIEKGQDIMDIWLDSGLSWANVLDGTKVADLYLEGLDQFNGWFQSSLLTSVAIRDKAPYKSIYVHGFAVDENGNKMSKSLGNVIDPIDITNGNRKDKKKPYGVDTLRWWVTCHVNQSSQASVTATALQSSADEVQKIRSVLRFALSSLNDYQPTITDCEHLLLIDRYMLHLLYKFHQQINDYFGTYQFHKVSFTVINFLTTSVSAIYYSAIKDRLYCDAWDSMTRRSAQFTLWNVFEIVSQSVAPIVPHLVEEMYHYWPLKKDNEKTYFTSTHLKVQEEWLDMDLQNVMDPIMDLRREINRELISGAMEAEVTVQLSKKYFMSLEKFGTLRDIEEQLTDILQVYKVNLLLQDNQTEAYKLAHYTKNKKCNICPRCRKNQEQIQQSLCKRCNDVVKNVLQNSKERIVN